MLNNLASENITWSSWELGLQLLLLHSLNLLRRGHCHSVLFLISLTHLGAKGFKVITQVSENL